MLTACLNRFDCFKLILKNSLLFEGGGGGAVALNSLNSYILYIIIWLFNAHIAS